MVSLIAVGQLDRQLSSRLEIEQEVIQLHGIPIARERQAHVVDDGTL